MILQVAKLGPVSRAAGMDCEYQLDQRWEDRWERAARFQFMDGMIKDDENEWVSCTKI